MTIDTKELRQSIAMYGLEATCADDLLGLVDRLEAAEKERNDLRAENAALVDDMNLLRDNNTALRAKVEAMERQEPVGWLFDGDFYEVRQMSLYKDNEPLQGQTALYALPGAQPAPSVSDGWKEAAIAWEVCGSLHREYAKGKDPFFKKRQEDFVKHANDARAMIAAAQEAKP